MVVFYERPNFVASVYQISIIVGIASLLSILYQFRQYQRYLDRKQRAEKINVEAENEIEGEIKNKTAIHSYPVVYTHKLWNYPIHVLTIGDMTVGEVFILILFLLINFIFLIIPLES